ncbi:MFS transporter [Plantactinospora sp. KBS50]|uniref:MFS transporter n=1 Tax=Plantactinospora sp. KBS50 TaxID=2024580 RepID=UPI000BAB0F87|nr:MFS transporter [Plantactinospora sp. KBS50]ASW54955.1 hypothetical protein CIK06_13295 [Plantactinospora sp. KBS50]
MPRTRWPALLAVLLLAVNLRATIAGLAPLLPDIRADLGLGRAAGGLLTTLPVLCFGLLAGPAALLGQRLGVRRSVVAAMLAVFAGSLLRAAPGVGWLVAGTAVVGAGVAVGNVLLPTAVKQDFPARPGGVTGLTMAAMTGGAAVAAAVATPLAHAAGLGWRATLVLLGGSAAVAAPAWALRARHRQPASPPAVAGNARAILRTSLTWQLAGFMAMQSLVFYAVLAWLPALLRDAGVPATGAGSALALYNLLGIGTALLVPPLAARSRGQRPIVLVICLGWLAGLLGLLAVPALYPLWSVLAGLAQGAGISLALTLIVLRADTPATARDLSGTVQSVGYLLGSTGPLVLGVLRDVSGGWTLPLLALCLAVLVMAGAGLGAGRDRRLVPAGGTANEEEPCVPR